MSDDPLAPTPEVAAPEAATGGVPEAPPGLDGDIPIADLSVESLLDDVERLTRERDEFLDALRRSQADFDNYRKRALRQQAEQAEHATGRLVEELLPVLDACDGAMIHGAIDVEPVFTALLGALEKEGLERIDPAGEAFDPTRHEAVIHEPSDDGDGTVVAEVMRRGYAWKGRVVRPAMVKVRG